MIHSAYIFRSLAEAPGIFDTFVHGFFLVKGIPLFIQLAVLTLFPIACLMAFLEQVQGNAKWGKTAQVSSLFSLFFITVLLLEPFDELFVNLLHSVNFTEVGRYSFSKLQPVEGTVDFFNYFLIGLLGKIGLPPLESAFGLSSLGGILCVLCLGNLLERFQFPHGKTWGILFFSLFPPLCFNASQGFSTTLFAAAIFGSFLFFTVTKKEKWGLLLLSLVPVIRIEGAWYSLLFFVLFVVPVYRRKPVQLVWAALGVFLPVTILSLWRWSYFGSPIPPPVLFKAAAGNLFFFLIGVRNIFADLLASYGILGTLILLLSKKILTEKEGQIFQPLYRFVTLLFFFTFPYYLSGGDWFPAIWGRYALPLSLGIALGAIVVAQKMVVKLSSKWSSVETLVPYLLSLPAITVILTTGSYPRFFEDVFSYRKTLSNTHIKKTVRTNYRVQYLSQLGVHLRNTTPETAVIGSSELATISYHAQRETLDFLGLTNPEIIRQPLRSPELIRRIPRDNELPFLIFKRVNPTLLGKYRPDILYTFDFIPKDLAEYVGFHELNNQKVFEVLARWEVKFRGLLAPIYGGLENILKLGYRPVVVIYDNGFSSMYFVASEKAAEHIALLKKFGLEGGLVERKN